MDTLFSLTTGGGGELCRYLISGFVSLNGSRMKLLWGMLLAVWWQVALCAMQDLCAVGYLISSQTGQVASEHKGNCNPKEHGHTHAHTSTNTQKLTSQQM